MLAAIEYVLCKILVLRFSALAVLSLTVDDIEEQHVVAVVVAVAVTQDYEGFVGLPFTQNVGSLPTTETSISRYG